VLLPELSAAHVQAMFTAIIRQHQALGAPLTARRPMAASPHRALAHHRRASGGRGVDGSADRAVPHSAQEDRLYAAYHLIALRGLRRG
jgi:hypothetical protein